MKKLFVILLSLALLLACVPTPEEEYVIQKNADRPNASAPSETEDIPTHISASFTENGVEIAFDAEPELPDCEHLFSVRSDAVSFETYDLDRIVKALFGDATLYDFDRPLKKDLEADLLQALQDLAEVKAHPERYEAGVEYYQGLVDDLQKEYNAAPDADELTPITVGWKTNGDATYFCCRGDVGGRFGRLSILNQHTQEDDVNSYLTFWYQYYYKSLTDVRRDDPNAPQPNPAVSREEAIRIATELVSDLGANHLAFAACEEGLPEDLYIQQLAPDAYEHAAWLVYFTYARDGMQTVYDPTFTASGEQDDHQTYAMPLYYERITVAVDESGVVFLCWRGPTEDREAVSDDVPALPTDTLLPIAAKYLSYLYPTSIAIQEANDADQAVSLDALSRGSVVLCSIRITRITLGWTQTVSGGTNRTSTRIPVWDFFGSVTRTYENGETEVSENDLVSLLTLDASTGARIDRKLGY